MAKMLLPIGLFLFLTTMCAMELPKAIDKTMDIYSNNYDGIDREAVIRGTQ